MLGCLNCLKSNGWLLTFLLFGWFYAAIAFETSPQATHPQPPGSPQTTVQPASIPLPGPATSSQANQPVLTPVEVAAKPNPLTFTVPEVFQGKTIYRVNPIRARKVIALTFSGGPWPNNTEQILAILKRYHVKATFFWVGQAVADQPDLARQVVAQGHAIGNQPWSSPDSPPSRFALAQEIERTAQIIQQTTGVTSTLFRPSQTPLNKALLLQAQRQQYTTILWSVDAGDEDSSDAIVDRVLQDASSGAIVQMQDGGGDRVALIQALPQIIMLLRRQGYQFLTVPDLLEQQTHLQTRPI
ncbi:polysaccharide deacetylase family protein [Trichothermofontia sp.]